MFFKRLDFKYYFIVIMGYTLLLVFAIGCIFMQSDRVHKQLEFYDNNEYQYIYIVSNSSKVNDYLYGEPIYFYADSDMKNSLLGDCVMSLDDSEYNQETPLAVSKKLSNREVALSFNLAQRHGLKVGSKVYSKHNIKNIVEEYTVAEILPVCYGIRRVDYDINRGVILMGYDEDYKANTDYPYIAFSANDPSALIQSSGIALIDLISKDSHREALLEKVIVWQSIISTCISILTILYAALHWKYQKNYYSRLYLLGCPSRKIKKQIFADMLVPGAIGQVLSFVFCALLASINNMYFSYKTALISVGIGLIVLLCSSIITLHSGRNV